MLLRSGPCLSSDMSYMLLSIWKKRRHWGELLIMDTSVEEGMSSLTHEICGFLSVLLFGQIDDEMPWNTFIKSAAFAFSLYMNLKMVDFLYIFIWGLTTHYINVLPTSAPQPNYHNLWFFYVDLHYNPSGLPMFSVHNPLAQTVEHVSRIYWKHWLFMDV